LIDQYFWSENNVQFEKKGLDLKKGRLLDEIDLDEIDLEISWK
jgi:hypothetical protein